jgi:hypothetical protein
MLSHCVTVTGLKATDPAAIGKRAVETAVRDLRREMSVDVSRCQDLEQS